MVLPVSSWHCCWWTISRAHMSPRTLLQLIQNVTSLGNSRSLKLREVVSTCVNDGTVVRNGSRCGTTGKIVYQNSEL
ncbi:unnamed protein product [Allacma fusca]|uniref:Secreted protein n=1 Tax=Allacma fusca TaxID=39272 RepID=A0A8J2PL58_9HEXA|nr:unnamed protein product [Allacma fusca]